MSFQAPATDADAAGGFKAPEDDLEPPKSLEGFLGNALNNAGRAINPLNIVKGAASSLKEGLYDIPKAVGESSVDLLKGAAKAATGGGLPDMEDVAKTPILEKTRQMVEPMASDPVGFAYKNPVDAAMLAATPFMGLMGGEGAAAARGTIPEAAEMAGELKEGTPPIVEAKEAPTPVAPPPPEAPPAPRGTIPTPPAAAPLRDLPVVQPGLKTGDPHALFAYNDTFGGPNGEPRSIYNVFGDPGHPKINAVGGYGTSVPKEILDQAGIPVTGREPRSVGKWEPIESPAGGAPPPEPPKVPPGGAGSPPIGPEPPPPPKPSIFERGAEKAIDEAKELKNYVTRGYEGYAKKPGALSDVADWVQEKSQMMAAQQLGVTPNQARQLGKSPLASHNAMRAIGQYAMDKGIVDPTTGLGGMLEKNNALIKSVGKQLGDFRELADKLNPTLDPKEVVAEVRKALDKKYMRTVKNAEGEESAPRGAYGGQTGAYVRALQELEDAEKSHSGIADAATELNHAANKASKNMQPETPFTDVANEVSRINNAKIKELLGPEKAAQYEQALREYGVNKKIANALKFKSSGEVKRFGPGSTFSNLTQKAMDELGYRVGAKTANKLSTAIKNNPSIGGNLPSMFKEFIHQVEDVGHDVTGMAHGGIVPDDVRKYVSKC